MVGDPLLVKKTIRHALLALALLTTGLNAQKFYDDDPIQKEPPPLNVPKIQGRKLSDYYDFFSNTFAKPGERQSKGKQIPAQAVNTLGEVPDSAWYTNRHGKVRMSIPELVRGPGGQAAPDTSGPLTVVGAKTEGVMPGFRIEDSKGRRYFVKFDPLKNPEMATGADVIASKFLYALGYNVPGTYLFDLCTERVRLSPDAAVVDAEGKRRLMTSRDVTEILLNVPRGRNGCYRAVASLQLEGKPLGEFRYYGTRTDDPNDIVPHEHRRDLRGLRVFCAWLGHDDSRAINTLDTLVEENGTQLVRHHLIDFGATLGSDSNWPNSPRSGFGYWFAWRPAAVQFFSLGLVVPRWARAKYPRIPAVGRFEAEVFDPEKWMPFYPSAAFDNCLPDDAFWAAKQVMAFSDAEIRAIVKTGEYSDPSAERWIVDCLVMRRDKIGRAYSAKVLPLDRFGVQDGKLVFDNLAVEHGVAAPSDYQVEWFKFDNQSGSKTPLPLDRTLALPQDLKVAAPGEYFGAHIQGGDPKKTVTVYLRKRSGEIEVVGIDRTW
jgi:hypothetical protein